MTMKRLPIQTDSPFALIKRRGEGEVIALTGRIEKFDVLEQIPLSYGIDPRGEKFDTLSAVPFAQVKERGFEAIQDDARILTLIVEKQTSVPMSLLSRDLPEERIELDGDVRYHLQREEYERVIASVINEEIGNGEGANFVTPRIGNAKIKQMSPEKALTIFRRLIEDEFGSYWTFLYFTGEQYLIGATPERHLWVRDGKTRMNPISGTYRKKPEMSIEEFKKGLLGFLGDEKEVNELFMVVDEELKMMAQMCSKGGMIIGPLIKEMANLVHTEYLLSGESHLDVIELLKRSMFAATVTGSPVKNACRVIAKHEVFARRYYGSMLALIGRDTAGEPTLDGPITIRTVEIDLEGNACLKVGGTLVRDSIPSEEVEETEAKIKSLVSCLQGERRVRPKQYMAELQGDDDVEEVRQERNQHLSAFWFFKQSPEEDTVRKLQGKSVRIVDFEDDFCRMLGHMIRRMGVKVTFANHADSVQYSDEHDLVIVGPGPGNPVDHDCKKMIAGRQCVRSLLETQRPFLAVCLGHQFLCLELGLRIKRKVKPFQGTQETISFFGQPERVGFYNTFAGNDPGNRSDIEICSDEDSQEIHAIRGDHYFGIQFHPESILSKNGFVILQKIFTDLIG